MLCASRRTRTEPRTRTESPRRARGRNQVDRRRFGGRPLCQVVTASNRRDWHRADRSRFIDGRNPRLLSAVVWFFRKRTLRSLVRRHGQNVERHGLLLRRRPRGAPRRRVHARSAPRPHPRRDDETPRARRPSPPRRRRGVVRGGRDRPEGARATRHRSRRSIDASASLVGTVVLHPSLTPPRALPAHPPHPPGLQSPRRRQHRRRRAARRRQASRVRLSRQGARALGGERARAVRRRVRERRRRVRGRHRRGLARRRRARAQRRVRRRRRDRVVRGNDRVPFGAVEGWERTGGDGFRFRRVLSHTGPHTTASAW